MNRNHLLSLILLVPLLIGSCSTGTGTGKKPKKIETAPPIVVAYAQKDQIVEGQDLVVAIKLQVRDSSWQVGEADAEVEGNQITITPKVEREQGGTATAIASERSTTKRVKGLKPGKYTVTVVGWKQPIEVVVSPKAK